MIDAVLRERNWGYMPEVNEFTDKERKEIQRTLLAALVGALEVMFEEEQR
jgi:hypothetical protein